MTPTIGSDAPSHTFSVIGGDFEEETETSIQNFKGRKLVLYFYPKNNTPG